MDNVCWEILPLLLSALQPEDVLETCVGLVVQNRGNKDETLGRVEEGCEDSGVENDGVKGADRIRFVSELARFRNGCQVGNQNTSSTWQLGLDFIGALLVASMEVNLVLSLDQLAGSFEAKAVGRSGDEDSGHDGSGIVF
ncbi:unnamed protein product [Fusarium graminearum]|nr:unnamed protein product [Fusarium graminearum]